MQANIASLGTADVFIRASHVTKTHHAYKVTAAGLYILLHQAYSDENSTSDQAGAPDARSFEEWCSERARTGIHFDYWRTVQTGVQSRQPS